MIRLPIFARMSRILSQTIRIASAPPQIYIKKFTEHRYCTTTYQSKIGPNNILSSGVPDVKIEDTLLHDFIWQDLSRRDSKDALECAVTRKRYTYKQMRLACNKMALAFRNLDLLPGDTVAIVLPNIPEYVITALAASEAGLQITPVNLRYTILEIGCQLRQTNAKAVITFPEKYFDVELAKEYLTTDIPIIVIDGNDGFTILPIEKFQHVVTIYNNQSYLFDVTNTGRHYTDTLFISYTSGTSDEPKAVETTHRNIVASIIQSSHPIFFPGRYEDGKGMQSIIPIMLPMYHISGLLTAFAYIRIGAKVVLIPEFSEENFIKVMENYWILALYVTPPIVQMMANSRRIISSRFSDVALSKMVISGGAPLSKHYMVQFRNLFDHVQLMQAYGTSELSSICTCGTKNTPPMSCGYLLPNTQMKIVDVNRNINLGPNEEGEIYVRGPQVMKGYKNETHFPDKAWYNTGDVGYFTKEGLLFVTGRLQDMIPVKGHLVSPIDLEEVIRGYYNIQDVAVIGVPDKEDKNIAKAFVVPKPGKSINVNDLKAFVAERGTETGDFQLKDVQFVSSIPKTVFGQILRRRLREL